MNLDETLMMAYVDGELSPEQSAEVESHLAASAEAAEAVARLRASRLDYRAAFAAQPLPPVPESLARSVAQLVEAHRRGAAASAPQRDAAPQPASTAAPQRPPAGTRGRQIPLWLTAACVAGAFALGLSLRTGPLVGTGPANGEAPWITAAVGYQQLYTRDTVAYAPMDAQRAGKVIADVQRENHLDLRVPDLSAAGLKLKAIQRLDFRNKALVQIVYLPEKGAPIALCEIHDPKPDAGVNARTVDSMHVVTWRQSGVGYALIGKPDGVDLAALGQAIAAGRAAQYPGAPAAAKTPA